MQNLSEIAWTQTFDTINDAITIHDTAFNIVKANKAAEKLLSLPLQKILSQKCYKSYHNTSTPPKNCQGCNVIMTGKPVRTEYFDKYLNKNIEIKTLPILDKNKEFMGIVHFVREYTKRDSMHNKILRIQEDLKQHAKELEDSNAAMKVRLEQREEDGNTALKVILKQGEEDIKELEKNILSNVNKLIIPNIIKLKRNCSSALELEYINIIELNLKDMVSSFSSKLSSESHKFTPREVNISHLIKEGYHDKDIAELISIAVDTVKFHRKNIRKKLGLTNKKGNLRTYLMSISG